MDRNKKGKSSKPHFMGSGELIALGKKGSGSETASSTERKPSSSGTSSSTSATKSLASSGSSSKLFSGGNFADLVVLQNYFLQVF